jgi:SAM-dependent methyltransferase
MTPREKHDAIRTLLKESAIWQETENCYNCLPPDIREKYVSGEGTDISSHGYDPFANDLIQKCSTGWVLDCGAGSRSEFLPNVVNFEIVAYPSTDVMGVAEELPFKDESFDGVLSLSVLEHVKDPFRAAKEIARVLKPGGQVYCVVPFLQPFHGYPHHYYNMTYMGLANLFSGSLKFDRHVLLTSGLPIWSLTWILKRWTEGLPEKAKAEFLEMRVADLIGEPATYLNMPFVSELSDALNAELASATGIFVSKPALPGISPG